MTSSPMRKNETSAHEPQTNAEVGERSNPGGSRSSPQRFAGSNPALCTILNEEQCFLKRSSSFDVMPTVSSVNTGSVALLILALLLVGGAAGALAQAGLTAARGEAPSLSIDAATTSGTNLYTMVEVDDGDNEERAEVTSVFHEFDFTARGVKEGALLTWDFGDGATATGTAVTHAFEHPGIYTVRVTSISPLGVETSSIGIEVDLQGEVESDNMECTCAPTGKSTLIDLQVIDAPVMLTGEVRVEHDGSSESCGLRNPLQECHVRVLLERVEEGDVIEQQELHDSTFRANELLIPFDLGAVDLDPGQTLRLRLETDQLRDWHKPRTAWIMAAAMN